MPQYARHAAHGVAGKATTEATSAKRMEKAVSFIVADLRWWSLWKCSGVSWYSDVA